MIMLDYSLYCLKETKKLCIGYFGGSITEGAGASDPEKTSWRAIISQWFRTRYPESEITTVQAAIGGTGTDLGAYRVEDNLLAFQPNLIFIEFAVNDSIVPYGEVLRNTETILRKIWTARPKADVVMIYTTKKEMADLLSNGGEFYSRTAHAALAHHYGEIPQIDMGEVLRQKITEDGGNWEAYTTDLVHPNDRGYRVYASCVAERLSCWLDETKSKGAYESFEKQMPEPLTHALRMHAHMEDAWRASGEGWTKTEKSMCGRYPHMLEGLEPGTELTYTFEGTRIGLYWMMAEDSGDIWLSVDGGKPVFYRAWDHYCRTFSRADSIFIPEELPYGVHTMRLRIAETRAPESKGYAVRIGAFLVS